MTKLHLSAHILKHSGTEDCAHLHLVGAMSVEIGQVKPFQGGVMGRQRFRQGG